MSNSLKKVIKFLIIGILVVIIGYLIINIKNMFFGVTLPAFTMSHFRTNIFTGQCSYGGKSGNVVSDPWYFKPDCKVDQKIKIAKKEGFYNDRYSECQNYCNSKQKDYFCNTLYITIGDAWGNGPENLLCTDIVNCSVINCAEYAKCRESNSNESGCQ